MTTEPARKPPLPDGARVYSSGSGWIADGNGGRYRAGKGRIICAVEYRVSDKDWPPTGWVYEVQWDCLDHPTTRIEHCLCLVDPLEALADCAE